MPTIKTIKPGGGGDYTSLQDWWDWAKTQATADQWAECYSGNLGPLDATTGTTFTPDATLYPRIYVASGHQHAMAWDDTKAHIYVADMAGPEFVVAIQVDYMQVQGLQIKAGPVGGGSGGGQILCTNWSGASGTGAGLLEDLLIIAEGASNTIIGITTYPRSDGRVCAMRNCLVYGCGTAGIYAIQHQANTHIDNCGIVECGNASGTGLRNVAVSFDDLVVRNTYVMSTGSAQCFNHTYFPTTFKLYNCFSSDDSIDTYTNTDCVTDIATSGQVEDLDADWRVASGSDFIDAGMDLSADFTADALGNIREVPWWIGPHQDAPPTPIPSPVRSTRVDDFDTSELINPNHPLTSGLQMLLAPVLGPGLGSIDLVRRMRLARAGSPLPALAGEREWGQAWQFSGGRLASARAPWSSRGGPYTLSVLARGANFEIGSTLVRFGSIVTGVNLLMFFVSGGIQVNPLYVDSGTPSNMPVVTSASTSAMSLISVIFDGDRLSIWQNDNHLVSSSIDLPGHELVAGSGIQVGAGNAASDTGWPLVGAVAGMALWDHVIAPSDLARLSMPAGFFALLQRERPRRHRRHNLLVATCELEAVFTATSSDILHANATCELDAVFTVTSTDRLRANATCELEAVFTVTSTDELVDPPSTCELTADFTVFSTDVLYSNATCELEAVFTVTSSGSVRLAALCELEAVFTVTSSGGPVLLAECELEAVFTATSTDVVTASYAWADFEVPAWGEFATGVQGLGGGVALSQVGLADGSFPDRGQVSLRATCSGAAGSGWVAVDLQETRLRTFTRLMFAQGTLAGAGQVCIAEAGNGVDACWRLLVVPDTGALVLELPLGHSISAALHGLAWACLEVMYDADAGSASLWVDGVLADTVTDEDLEGVAPDRVMVGVLDGASGTTGYLLLDEVRVRSHRAGPVFVRPVLQNMSDSARWIVLANADAPDAIAFANECINAQGLPWSNVALVSAGDPSGAGLDEAGYDSLYAALVAFLVDHRYGTSIGGIIVAPGFPALGLVEIGADLVYLSALLALGDGTTSSRANPRYLPGPVDAMDLPGRSSLLRAPGAGFLVMDAYTGQTSQAAALVDSYGFSALTVADKLAAPSSSGAWPTLDAWRGSIQAQGLMLRPSVGAGKGNSIELIRSTAEDFSVTGQTRALFVGAGSIDAYLAVDPGGYAYAIAGDGADLPNPAALFAALNAGWTMAEALGVACPTLGASFLALGDPLGLLKTPKQGYHVYERETRTSAAELVACVPAGITTVTLSGYAPGDQRYYEVRAVSRTGKEDAEPQRLVSARFADSGSLVQAAPNPPVSLRLERRAGGRVLCTWAYVAAQQAAPVKAFRVFVAIGVSPVFNFSTPAGSLVINGQLSQGFRFLAGPFADGAVVNVIVRSEAATGARENNLFAAQITADASAPATPTSLEVEID